MNRLMVGFLPHITVLVAGGLNAGCIGDIVVAFTDDKAAMPPQEGAQAAEDYFWEVFTGDRFQDLPEAIERLTKVFVDNPGDGRTALLLGHAHFWRLAERDRDPEAGARVIEHAVLTEKYFEEAERLNPDDERIHAWLGGARMILGNIFGDKKLLMGGFFQSMGGAESHPAFNLVTVGFTMTAAPRDTPPFEKGVEYLWEGIESCAGADISKESPDFRTALAPADNPPPREDGEVCWNSPHNPHNTEGIFLKMGDLLVETGQAELAKKAYAMVKESSAFSTWKYAAVVDQRIAAAESNASAFAKGDAPEHAGGSVPPCTGCHAK